MYGRTCTLLGPLRAMSPSEGEKNETWWMGMERERERERAKVRGSHASKARFILILRVYACFEEHACSLHIDTVTLLQRPLWSLNHCASTIVRMALQDLSQKQKVR